MANPLLQFLGKPAMVGTGRVQDYFPPPPDLSYLGATAEPFQRTLDPIADHEANQARFDEQQALTKLRGLDSTDPQYGEKVLVVMNQHPYAERSPLVKGHIDLARSLAPSMKPLEFESPEDEKFYHEQIVDGKHPRDARQQLDYFVQDRQAKTKLQGLGLDPEKFIKDGKLDRDAARVGIAQQENRNELASTGMDSDQITELQKKYPTGIPKDIITSAKVLAEREASAQGGRRQASSVQSTDAFGKPWSQKQEWETSGYTPSRADVAANERQKKEIVNEINTQLDNSQVPDVDRKGIFNKDGSPNEVAFKRAIERRTVQDQLELANVPKDHIKKVFNEDGSVNHLMASRVLDSKKSETELKSLRVEPSRIEEIRDPETGLLDIEGVNGLRSEQASKVRRPMEASRAKNLYDEYKKALESVPAQQDKEEWLKTQGVDPKTATPKQWDAAYEAISSADPSRQSFKARLQQDANDLFEIDPSIMQKFNVRYPEGVNWDPKTKTLHPVGQPPGGGDGFGKPLLPHKGEVPKQLTESSAKYTELVNDPNLTVEQADALKQKQDELKKQEEINKDWTGAKTKLHEALAGKVPPAKLAQIYNSIQATRNTSGNSLDVFSDALSGQTEKSEDTYDKHIKSLEKVLGDAGIKLSDDASKFGLKAKKGESGSFTVKDLLNTLTQDTSISKTPSIGEPIKTQAGTATPIQRPKDQGGAEEDAGNPLAQRYSLGGASSGEKGKSITVVDNQTGKRFPLGSDYPTNEGVTFKDVNIHPNRNKTSATILVDGKEVKLGFQGNTPQSTEPIKSESGQERPDPGDEGKLVPNIPDDRTQIRSMAESVAKDIFKGRYKDGKIPASAGKKDMSGREFIMALQEEFGVEIPDDFAEHMETIRDVENFMAGHRNAMESQSKK